jgi:agmatine/peptidylarginine deiminase
MDAYNILTNSEDARARKFEIHKLHIPNPLYMTEEEANGLIVRPFNIDINLHIVGFPSEIERVYDQVIIAPYDI